MIESFFAELKTQTTLVTPNQRLAATLTKKYARYQLNQGKRAWPTLDVLPLSSWIKRLWAEERARALAAPTLLLSANQELSLWEEIISAAPESAKLLKISELAQLAKSAWLILKQWQTDTQDPSFAYIENSRAFQSWSAKFAQLCTEKKWLDSASLTSEVMAKIAMGKLSLPSKLILLNFAELSPQNQALLELCREQGVDIKKHSFKCDNNQVYQFACADKRMEMETAACWAKNILNKEPEATVGLIVPQLEQERTELLAIFEEVFSVETSNDQLELKAKCLSQGDRRPPLPIRYNISAGQPLSSYPLIQAAIQLLALSRKALSYTQLSQLLHSSFLGESEIERQERLYFDSFLRRNNLSSLNWEQLLNQPQLNFKNCCPLFYGRSAAFLQHQQQRPQSQTISEWVKHFVQALELIGWPGELSLNSHEYQVAQRWLNLLKETAELDLVLPALTYRKALHYLEVLATKTYFQPESPDAPVQILGVLEGSGLPFDYLWVMGFDDTVWPPAPSPNPLIPAELQKKLAMPNASAERELKYCQEITTQLKKAAATVVFSYSQHNEKEELRPSPLIAKFDHLTTSTLQLAPLKRLHKQIFASRAIEFYYDSLAPAILPWEKIRGGSNIFKLQATCPFKAFAELRLAATALEEPTTGLRPQDRGIVVHKILELLWRELGDQATLIQTPDEHLQEKISFAVTTALTQSLPLIPKKSRYLQLMQERLEKLIWQWLLVEKARPRFSVAATEQERQLELGKLQIKLRIDRIDTLASGGKLIIDYKTKKSCSLADCFGPRPTEPQLPLYYLLEPELTAGFAFAQLHATKTELKGIAFQPMDLMGMKTLEQDWQNQLEEWRLQLKQLAEDFQEGIATVDPKDRSESCRHCKLSSLCRINDSVYL